MTSLVAVSPKLRSRRWVVVDVRQSGQARDRSDVPAVVNKASGTLAAIRCGDAPFAATVRDVKRYFIETSAPDAADLGDSLWNEDEDTTRSDRNLVMDQYKLYVELADRVSARRALANTFFLTLNTAIFTAIGIFWKTPPSRLRGWASSQLPCSCSSAWSGSGSSDPTASSTLGSGLWSGLSSAACQHRRGGRLSGRRWAKARIRHVTGQLTHVEQWVPFLFAIAYIGGFLALVFVHGGNA